MENFEFVSPTHFVFGRGAEEQVGEKLAAAGAKRVLVHFGGGSAVASGLIDRVGASLDAAGIEHLELGGVRPNPEITLVREGVRLCKEANVDWVLAVGGGSVIDSAKAIANGACVEGDVWELFETKATDHDVLPIAVVLTIPAAGSEASKNTVISNDELGRKTGYANNAQRPKFAFMNPELTFTLPPFQTAAGLTDMFCHLLERFFDDLGAVPVTDNLNLSLMNTIRAEAPRVLADPDNYDARANIMWAGMLCHQGLAGVGRHEDWATHGLEHELSALNPAITHGAGLAVMFPAWMEYVLQREPGALRLLRPGGVRPHADRRRGSRRAFGHRRDALLLREPGDAHHSCRAGRGRDRHPEDAADAGPEQGHPLRHLQEADPGRRRGHLQAGAVGGGVRKPNSRAAVLRCRASPASSRGSKGGRTPRGRVRVCQ